MINIIAATVPDKAITEPGDKSMLPINIIMDSPNASIANGAVCNNRILWLYGVRKWGDSIADAINKPINAIKGFISSYTLIFLHKLIRELDFSEPDTLFTSLYAALGTGVSKNRVSPLMSFIN